MTTLGLVAHRRKSLGDGLDVLRSMLADAGHVDLGDHDGVHQSREQAHIGAVLRGDPEPGHFSSATQPSPTALQNSPGWR